MARYRVRAGYEHDGCVAGVVIELTENQARSWADKFEPVNEPVGAEVAPEADVEPAEAPRDAPEPVESAEAPGPRLAKPKTKVKGKSKR